jgi:hypothetical protein
MRKYSIFVSSTYEDLKAERQVVNSAILRLGSIPIGMEDFPASAIQQLEQIKQLIDECDYFLVISAARYGTIHPGLSKSFTQLELEYAESKGIPILRFVHGNIDSISRKKHEDTSRGEVQLRQFHNHLKASGFNCDAFLSPEDLGMRVSTALTNAFKSNPRPGWLRETARPKDSNQLDGIWQLLPDPSRGTDQLAMVNDGIRRLKTYVGGNYEVIWYAPTTGVVSFSLGGSYSREGQRYIETCIYSSNHSMCPPRYVSPGRLKLSDPYLDWTADNGLNEHWQRIDQFPSYLVSPPNTSTTASPTFGTRM